MKANPESNLDCCVKGASAELRVCADLLLRGYEVFRSISPHCSCDLMIQKDGNIYRVEVKTASLLDDGRYAYPTCDKEKSDIRAFVYMETGAILYDSPLPWQK